MDTRIAVVIPCYNDGGTLFEALASVERQEDCELVVVNDGSDEPATHRVLTDLRRRGIRVVDRDNGGLSAARMTGTRATSARYVFPLDADDILEPGALSRLADALDDDPAAVAAWGDVEQFGRYTRRLRVQRTLDPWRVTYLTGIPGTVLYRRSALLAVGGWHLQEGYEDWDLWMSLAERGMQRRLCPWPVSPSPAPRAALVVSVGASTRRVLRRAASAPLGALRGTKRKSATVTRAWLGQARAPRHRGPADALGARQAQAVSARNRAGTCSLRGSPGPAGQGTGAGCERRRLSRR